MAGTPPFKVYSAEGSYLASFYVPEHAGMLLAGLGTEGTTIRKGHAKKHTVWTDGVDGWANESYDAVAHHVHNAG